MNDVHEHLSSLSSDSPGQQDVLWHNGNTLGVDGAQVGVFKQTNKIGLRCFLKYKKKEGVKM